MPHTRREFRIRLRACAGTWGAGRRMDRSCSRGPRLRGLGRRRAIHVQRGGGPSLRTRFKVSRSIKACLSGLADRPGPDASPHPVRDGPPRRPVSNEKFDALKAWRAMCMRREDASLCGRRILDFGEGLRLRQLLRPLGAVFWLILAPRPTRQEASGGVIFPDRPLNREPPDKRPVDHLDYQHFFRAVREAFGCPLPQLRPRGPRRNSMRGTDRERVQPVATVKVQQDRLDQDRPGDLRGVP